MPAENETYLIDTGTGYSKLHRLSDGARRIIRSKDLAVELGGKRVPLACGHNAGRFAENTVNELVALAKGARKLAGDWDYLVIDTGSRDIKYLRMQGWDVVRMDWNTECGAFAGQVIELLIDHFGFDTAGIEPSDEPLPVACGVLGMTAMFDLIAKDIAPERAFARFIKGVADNVWRFAGKPDRFYLSGGLCENRLFVRSFQQSDVVPLGRYVLVEGLMEEYEVTE
jgi:activator of 2-hydroxyglutaryl-CoA dehydratase